MNTFAIIKSDGTIENTVIANDIGDVSVPVGSTILPVVEQLIDTSTEGNPTVSTLTETVEDDRLLRVKTIRDKTPAELDTEDDDRITRSFDVTGISRALALMTFDQENRLRLLESRPSVTLDQFKAAIKSRMR